MMSILTTRETYVGRASGRPAPNQSTTGPTPASWATRPEDDAQSATFRALAWSQDDDSVAEPVTYTGGEYPASEVDSEPSARFAADTVQPRTARRSSLLYGIASGVAAIAFGGLVFSVTQGHSTPATIPVTVTQPAQNIVTTQSAVRPASPSAGGTPAQVVPPAVASTPAAVASTPAVAASHSGAPVPGALVPGAPVPDAAEAGTPPAGAPQAAVPENPAPEFTAPVVSAPIVSAPVVPAPVVSAPVVSAPVVSVPEVTPMPVPHPVGPPSFHVATVPDTGITLPPAKLAPVGPVEPGPVISVKPVVTLPPIIATLPVGADQ